MSDTLLLPVPSIRRGLCLCLSSVVASVISKSMLSKCHGKNKGLIRKWKQKGNERAHSGGEPVKTGYECARGDWEWELKLYPPGSHGEEAHLEIVLYLPRFRVDTLEVDVCVVGSVLEVEDELYALFLPVSLDAEP